MAKMLGTQWPVGVCFYVGEGDDVKTLAGQMDKDIDKALSEAHADFDVRLGSPIQQNAEKLATEIQTDRWSILHIVAHGASDGAIAGRDPWGDLMIEKERLSRVVHSHRVRLAVIMSCFGAQVARELVETGAVDVAIGMTTPMPFSVALGFSKAFYHSLAQGRSIRRAFCDGRDMAGLRVDHLPEELHLFSKPDSDAPDLKMCDPADFFLMGRRENRKAIRKMIKALRPHTGFHVDASLLDPNGPVYVGVAKEELMMKRFNAAKVVMLLFEGDQEGDATLAELVTRAVHRAASGDVRLFPVYLKGRGPNPKLPFGLMRLVPACLDDFDGSYKKLGKYLARLIP